MTDTTGQTTAGFWAVLGRRKVVQWGLAYSATAWTLLQGLEYASETFYWAEPIRQLATLIAAMGLPIVTVVAWYHGDRGNQRVQRTEVFILTLLLLIFGAVLWLYEPVQPDRLAETGAAVSAASTAPAAAAEASVAVLPFVALSSGTDDAYFADGLTDEIINALSALPDVLVTARTSAFYFKGKEVPVPEIARILGVAHIVEGSLRRSGDKVRITAQLIRAADGFHLFSQTYDYTEGEDFEVQTQIAESVAAALGVLLDERKRGLMAVAGVRDVQAFVAFQQGVQLFDRAHNEGPLLSTLEQANAAFDTAIARHPDFAQAHFYHADLFAHFLIDHAPARGPGITLGDGTGVADAARRLLADLDAAYRSERDPSQRRVIGVIRTMVTADWRHLGEQVVQAYEGWDNCRHGLWIDQTAVVFGHGESALAQDLKRSLCDPLGGNWTREAITAVWIGRPLDGLQYADGLENRRGPDRDVNHARVLAFLSLGRLDEAEALYSSGGLDAPDVPPAMSLLALQIPAAAGRAEEWDRLRPTVEGDPTRLLVGAAVFGDRALANQTAGKLDSLTLGPMILLRVTDRCGCGSPFDLESTPNLAKLLHMGELRWAPPAPIRFPLKGW